MERWCRAELQSTCRAHESGLAYKTQPSFRLALWLGLDYTTGRRTLARSPPRIPTRRAWLSTVGSGTMSLRVLVVEDNADCAQSWAVLLKTQGYDAETAPDAPSALAAVESHPPDVVLLDIAMPGMHGWELAKRLRAMSLDKRPLLIAVTGHGREEDRQRSAEVGIDFHFIKPADPQQLLDLLEAHASRRLQLA
jgi:CheY-like chemotaxis protein